MKNPPSAPLISEFRFEGCGECKYYKPFNTSKMCRGCDAGENFQEVIEELDPYSDLFLSNMGDMADDDE